MREIISSIDIGSDTIKLVVSEIFNNDYNVLCALSIPSKGFSNYQITNEEELIKTLQKILDEAEEKLGFRIKKIIANIPCETNNFIVSEAVNTITNEDGAINSNDILKILQSSAYNKIGINDELIGAIPIYFRVGDQETMDPYGKKGKTLAAKTVLIVTSKKSVYDMINVLEKCGIEVIDITTAGLAVYYNFKNPDLDSKTGIIVNIGDTKTVLSVFSKGIFVNTSVIDSGGAYIDKDIAFMYKLKRNDARYLKENLALANIRRANPKDTLKIVNKNDEEMIINQYELTEIVASRVSDLLKLVKNAINHLTKKEISYIIITGGLTELQDFSIALSSSFGESAYIGMINELGARDNRYSVCHGMIRHFYEKLKLRHREYSTVSETDAENMCNKNSKISVPGDSILGKVFGYFFDN